MKGKKENNEKSEQKRKEKKEWGTNANTKKDEEQNKNGRKRERRKNNAIKKRKHGEEAPCGWRGQSIKTLPHSAAHRKLKIFCSNNLDHFIFHTSFFFLLLLQTFLSFVFPY